MSSPWGFSSGCVVMLHSRYGTLILTRPPIRSNGSWMRSCGINTTARSARLAVPAVYAAIDLISASIAQLATAPAPPLSLNPDPFSTRYDFFFETVWSLLLAWRRLLAANRHGTWHRLACRSSTLKMWTWNGTTRWAGGGRKYRWKTKDVPAPRITHLRFHPRPGELEGFSPIEAARLTWEGAAYSETVGVVLVQRFRCSLGVLKAPTPLTSDEATDLRDQWNAARNGSTEYGGACRGGWNTNRSNSALPISAGWTHARRNAQEVARIFQIPPDLLGIAIQGGSGSITYKNLAEVGADFAQYCLEPVHHDHRRSLEAPPRAAAYHLRHHPLYKESLETRARTLQLLV